MSLDAYFSRRLSAALGHAIGPAARVGGGSINEAWRVEGAAGPILVKRHPRPPPRFFAAEAEGLALLSPHVRVPRVLAVLDDALALEWLEPATRTPGAEARAGHALAALHEVHGPRFGLDADNYMGAVRQPNQPASDPSFVAFFRERRLAPLARHLPAPVRRDLERLPLADLLTEPVAPTLIHGDLWGGNLLYATAGPAFIDPAVCHGHPEQDLAMTRLFGGFGDRFYAAYRERRAVVFDRALTDRLEVLQLWPLLVHVALFGGGYVSDVASIVSRFV